MQRDRRVYVPREYGYADVEYNYASGSDYDVSRDESRECGESGNSFHTGMGLDLRDGPSANCSIASRRAVEHRDLESGTLAAAYVPLGASLEPNGEFL